VYICLAGKGGVITVTLAGLGAIALAYMTFLLTDKFHTLVWEPAAAAAFKGLIPRQIQGRIHHLHTVFSPADIGIEYSKIDPLLYVVDRQSGRRHYVAGWVRRQIFYDGYLA
jgi:hypothetical protein